MHPDLSPHLHSNECNRLISELQNCHSQNKVGRFLGFCNDLDRELIKCLRAEREENRRKNLEKSRSRQQTVLEKL